MAIKSRNCGFEDRLKEKKLLACNTNPPFFVEIPTTGRTTISEWERDAS